jgi:glycogen synthase kinase 3 beta
MKIHLVISLLLCIGFAFCATTNFTELVSFKVYNCYTYDKPVHDYFGPQYFPEVAKSQQLSTGFWYSPGTGTQTQNLVFQLLSIANSEEDAENDKFNVLVSYNLLQGFNFTNGDNLNRLSLIPRSSSWYYIYDSIDYAKKSYYIMVYDPQTAEKYSITGTYKSKDKRSMKTMSFRIGGGRNGTYSGCGLIHSLQISPKYYAAADLDHTSFALLGWGNNYAIEAVHDYLYDEFYYGISVLDPPKPTKCLTVPANLMGGAFHKCPGKYEDYITKKTNMDVLQLDTGKTISIVKETFISEGGMGKVYKGKILESNTPVAIKVISILPNHRMHEVDLQRSMVHPNIMGVLYAYEVDSVKDTRDLVVVMDYYPHSFYSYALSTRNEGHYVPRSIVKILAYQMFRAIAYVHGKKLIHSDIKPDNFLVDHATNLAKLADFGSCKNMSDPKEKFRSYVVTRPYRAPELLLNSTNYSYPIDMWAAGVTLACLWTGGKSPFYAENNTVMLVRMYELLGVPTEEEKVKMNAKILNHTAEYTPRNWTDTLKRGMDPFALDLMLKIFKYDPEKRISAWQAMAHPYFDEVRQEAFHSGEIPTPNPFDWTWDEKHANPQFYDSITPEWYKKRIAASKPKKTDKKLVLNLDNFVV